MRRTLRLLTRTENLWRRAASAALLTLQVVIAVSSVIELREPVGPIVHVHDHETEHLFVHDESNCGLCAARTQVAAVPAIALVVTTELTTGRSTFVDRATPPERGLRTANASRAPPTLI